MKLTEKTKKILAISGGAVICVGLIVAIGLQFGKAPAANDKLPESTPSASDVVVNPSQPAVTTPETSTENKDVVVQPNTDATAGNDTQPVDTRPAQTDQTEQAIQPEVTKPAAPSEDAVKDPTTKPDGTKVDTPPTPVDHDTYTPPADAGDQNSGGGLPGFDNVPDGGANQVIEAEDMYENGNKIGSMD